jgi:phosphotriesterase-related protein
MKRREFLQFAALGAVPLLSPRTPVAGRDEVMTVLGPVAADRLGRTLMHEHVMVDFVGADKIRPGRYNPDEVFAKALPRLEELKAAGCQTLVECTPAFLGRDPELLRRLARASGLHLLTNTGIYGAASDKYVPAFAFRESARELAARWTREAEEGIPPSGIKPGFMKIGVDPGPLSEIDAKLVRGAAMTHQRTGLVIASHTGDGTAATAQIALLESLGVSLSAFIWVHAQNATDPALHRKAAERGAWVEFDGIAPATIPKYVKLVMNMKRAGLLERVLISQDSGWYHVGEPGGGTFRPYTTLFEYFVPALLEAGADSRDVETLLVRNPRQALAQPGFALRQPRTAPLAGAIMKD